MTLTTISPAEEAQLKASLREIADALESSYKLVDYRSMREGGDIYDLDYFRYMRAVKRLRVMTGELSLEDYQKRFGPLPRLEATP